MSTDHSRPCLFPEKLSEKFRLQCGRSIPEEALLKLVHRVCRHPCYSKQQTLPLIHKSFLTEKKNTLCHLADTAPGHLTLMETHGDSSYLANIAVSQNTKYVTFLPPSRVEEMTPIMIQRLWEGIVELISRHFCRHYVPYFQIWFFMIIAVCKRTREKASVWRACQIPHQA
jgi:hypothetical protein